MPPVGYYNAHLPIQQNAKGPVQSFSKSPRVIKVLAPATDPDLLAPESEVKMKMFSSFVDKRGISFDHQQSRDKVSYMKRINEA